MSLFDYPRINVKGTIQLNPGTANNDDYAGAATFPADWGPFAGATLALIDSKKVEARTYGMSDEAFISWVQQVQKFDTQPPMSPLIVPAEWNYYGAMDSQMKGTVIGVQTGPDGTGDDSLLGADLSFSGHFTDVNSEGSPPATQFFIDSLTLKKGDQVLLSGYPSKGACQWLNFYRNVNLTADGGAGGYVYHVIRKGPETTINIPGFEDPNIVGVIFRYYLYSPLGGPKDNEATVENYQQKTTSPKVAALAGTFAPLYANETLLTGPVGRLMVSNTTPIQAPAGTRNNGNKGQIGLAPAVLAQNGNVLSADFLATFPDYYQGKNQFNPNPDLVPNPKFDFGPVSLVVTSGTTSVTIGPVKYADTEGGDSKGWIFDFDISSNTAAQQALSDPNAVFTLVHSTIGTVLAETDYYFVSNQQALYGEQFGSGTELLNQGTTEPITVSVYHRGQELAAGSCPPVTVWQYRSIPLQSPGVAEAINANYQPGQPVQVDTSQPGSFLFTFTINDAASPAPAGYPPQSYATFMFPPYLTNSPSISLRILPNDEDFGRYYVDPSAKEPVGNDLLTFDVVYAKVLRTYYLLYPAMNLIFPLNSEEEVAKHAKGILKYTDPAIWMSIHYMPRTRDMSASRRTLLRAWCRKVLAA